MFSYSFNCFTNDLRVLSSCGPPFCSFIFLFILLVICFRVLQLLGRGGLGGHVVLDLGVRHGVGGVELLVGGEGSLLLTCAAGLFVRWRALAPLF